MRGARSLDGWARGSPRGQWVCAQRATPGLWGDPGRPRPLPAPQLQPVPRLPAPAPNPAPGPEGMEPAGGSFSSAPLTEGPSDTVKSADVTAAPAGAKPQDARCEPLGRRLRLGLGGAFPGASAGQGGPGPAGRHRTDGVTVQHCAPRLELMQRSATVWKPKPKPASSFCGRGPLVARRGWRDAGRGRVRTGRTAQRQRRDRPAELPKPAVWRGVPGSGGVSRAPRATRDAASGTRRAPAGAEDAGPARAAQSPLSRGLTA